MAQQFNSRDLMDPLGPMNPGVRSCSVNKGLNKGLFPRTVFS